MNEQNIKGFSRSCGVLIDNVQRGASRYRHAPRFTAANLRPGRVFC